MQCRFSQTTLNLDNTFKICSPAILQLNITTNETKYKTSEKEF